MGKASILYLSQKKNIKNGRKIAVLGDMYELGKKSEYFHLLLVKILITSNIQYVYTVGHFMEMVHKNISVKEIKRLHFYTVKKAIQFIKKDIHPNDIILVKGSFKSKVSKVVSELKSLK